MLFAIFNYYAFAFLGIFYLTYVFLKTLHTKLPYAWLSCCGLAIVFFGLIFVSHAPELQKSQGIQSIYVILFIINLL
ncbi:hypothetical protein ABTL21_19385, partial [Acinetobacter baumannii]